MVQIIAAKENMNDVEQFTKHSVMMRRSGKLVFATPEAANITLVFVSQGYIDDPRCQQDTIVASHDGKKIIPIFVGLCDWQRINCLWGIQGLPHRGFIHDSQIRSNNADAGWVEVIKGLEQLIT